MRLRQTILLAGALLILALALAPRADAYLYWTNQGANPGGAGIGRANTDGTDVNQHFIADPTGGPCMLAVNDTNLFWTNQTRDESVARANLDGTGFTHSLFSADTPCGIAVNSSFIYYSNDTTIGRANLDGTAPDPNFIPSPDGYPCGVTVDSSHIYWGHDGFIGRADLDGGNSDPSWLPGPDGPCGLAVDGSHIYWANEGSPATTIGRANLDGNPASVDNAFITGADLPCGVAVFNGKIYWGNYGNDAAPDTIGRANLDGTNVNQSFITGADAPCGPVVGAPNAFSAKVKGKKLIVTVQSPGTVGVSDAGAPLSASSAKKKRKLLLKSSSAAGNGPTITVKLKLTKLGNSKLKTKGKVSAKSRITFTPDGGTAATQTKKLKLKGKKKH
jgi:virginiamycin B lyase